MLARAGLPASVDLRAPKDQQHGSGSDERPAAHAVGVDVLPEQDETEHGDYGTACGDDRESGGRHRYCGNARAIARSRTASTNHAVPDPATTPT